MSKLENRIRHGKNRGCPTPEKASYPKEHEADNALSKAWRSHKWDGRKMPVRHYLCDCGAWHLSSISLSDWEATQGARP